MKTWSIPVTLIVGCLLASASRLSAATISAASCEQSDVLAAVARAAAGDTVAVPSGTCIWTTSQGYTPILSITKAITLQGAGIDRTFLQDATGIMAGEDLISLGSGARLTGFTFTDKRSVQDWKSPVSASGSGWRIDHNKFAPQTNFIGITAGGAGLIDHNTFVNTGHGIDVWGDGDASWSAPSAIGTANQVYIEDNLFSYDMPLDGAYDAYHGARYVFRHNTVNGTLIGHHGFDSGGLRSPYSFEIYNNTFTNSGAHLFTTMNIRGGSGLIFNNTVAASGGSFDSFAILRNYRSDSGYTGADGNSWGPCDGTSTYDGNTPGGQGYPCRDQIGRGTNQALSPVYLWSNTFKGAVPSVVVAGFADPTRAIGYHILPNREFYQPVSPYNGSSGVGSGLLAARPAACAPLAAYFATDTNTLYQCSSQNTWTRYYSPHPYPHPLQGGAPNDPPPAPPKNLRGP